MTPLAFIPLSANMAILLKHLIPYFSGQDVNDKREQKDLPEYIENFNFVVDDWTYTNEDQKLIVTQVIFQSYIYNKIFFWYYGLSSKMRASW